MIELLKNEGLIRYFFLTSVGQVIIKYNRKFLFLPSRFHLGKQADTLTEDTVVDNSWWIISQSNNPKKINIYSIVNYLTNDLLACLSLTSFCWAWKDNLPCPWDSYNSVAYTSAVERGQQQWTVRNVQGLQASSLQFTSPLEFSAIFRDGFTLRLKLNGWSKIRDPVPAKFKHVMNSVTCTLLCCDYVTYVPALWNFQKSWL